MGPKLRLTAERDVVDAALLVGVIVSVMSARLDPSWQVLASWESADQFRCVDIFSRPDGSWGFEEFRRDPEDMGAWTPVGYFSAASHPNQASAENAARRAVHWLTDELR